MAAVVSDFPGTARAGRYPWADWLDGQIWELEKDKDYFVAGIAVRQAAIVAAIRRGLKVRTCIREEGSKVYIQAYTGKRDAREKSTGRILADPNGNEATGLNRLDAILNAPANGVS